MFFYSFSKKRESFILLNKSENYKMCLSPFFTLKQPFEIPALVGIPQHNMTLEVQTITNVYAKLNYMLNCPHSIIPSEPFHHT